MVKYGKINRFIFIFERLRRHRLHSWWVCGEEDHYRRLGRWQKAWGRRHRNGGKAKSHCNRLRYSASEIRRPSPAIKLQQRLSTPRVYSTSHTRFHSDLINYSKFCVFSARFSSSAVIFFSILVILRTRDLLYGTKFHTVYSVVVLWLFVVFLKFYLCFYLIFIVNDVVMLFRYGIAYALHTSFTIW